MAKQKKAKAQSDEKSRTKVRRTVVEERSDDLAGLAKLPGGPVVAAGGGTIQAQATRLGDRRLQGAQRRALAAQIGRVQGNRHLQQVVDLAQAKRSDNLSEAETADRGQLVTVSTSVHPPTIQRDFLPDIPLRQQRLSGEAADREIRELFTFHIQQWAQTGRAERTAAGRISIVNETTFRREYEREYDTPIDQSRHPIDRMNAFVDASGHAWVRQQRGTWGTVVHEALHMYSNPEALEDRMGRLGKEGMTEYFTVQVCQQMEIERDYAEYRAAREAVERLADYVGGYYVRNAFFLDQITALGHQLDRRKGVWGAFYLWCRGMKEGRFDRANEIYELEPDRLARAAADARETDRRQRREDMERANRMVLQRATEFAGIDILSNQRGAMLRLRQLALPNPQVGQAPEWSYDTADDATRGRAIGIILGAVGEAQGGIDLLDSYFLPELDSALSRQTRAYPTSFLRELSVARGRRFPGEAPQLRWANR